MNLILLLLLFSLLVVSDSLNPMDCSMPGFLILHYLLEFAQTCVHSCHPAISSSVVPFSSCLQSFPAFSFKSALRIRWPKSASASVLPMNIQGWIPLGLTDLISLIKLSRVFSNTTVQKHQFFGTQPSLWYNSQICRFVIAFLPRSKHLLISWLQSPSAVILEPTKIKSVTVSMWSCIYFSATLNSSYLLLPPQGEVLCVHKSVLGACSCPGNRIINTIFIDSIYMHSHMIFVFLFPTYFILYNGFYVHPPQFNCLQFIPFCG